MLRLITDFDGPIIDVSERYYRVYQFCLEKIQRPSQQVRQLAKAEFWDLKRSRISEKQIAMISGLDEAEAQEFSQLRRQTVHTKHYFQYDTLAPGAVEALLKVQQAGIDLVVMTMRRTWELDYAFKKYDLGRFFPKNRCYCLTNDYIKTRDTDDKPLLMARAIQELPPATDTWMVGDTEADIISATKHGIKVIAVECGIRDSEALLLSADRAQQEQYQPNLILKDLSSAVDFVLDRTLQQTTEVGSWELSEPIYS